MEAHWKPAIPAFERPEPKMDPNETLRELRYLVKEFDFEDVPLARDIVERIQALDEWLTKGGFSPWPANKEPNRFADQRARMSDAQRNKLWEMCADYNVPFREDDYVFNYGMVEGWIGGTPGGPRFDGSKITRPVTIYVGVELNGNSHT